MKRFCFVIIFINFTICLYGQDIHSSAPVVLPLTGYTTYEVTSPQVRNISSSQSISLGPGTSLGLGATVSLTIDNHFSIPVPAANPVSDLSKNWILSRSYDEDGNEISTSKAFFDNNGKPTQTQSKSESTGQVLANQTIYDLQGRPVITTLSAPINNSAFAYKNGFVSYNGSEYSYTNFDGDPANVSNPLAKLNNPDPVDNTQQGTLGWYYSNNNSLEPFVANTSYPYSRGSYYNDGSAANKAAAGVGDALKMGAGHEVSSNSFPVQNELINYLAIRNQFFSAATVGSTPTSMEGQALQSISTDPNGTSGITVTDLTGKMTLMTGRADPNGYLTVTSSQNLTNSMPSYSLTVNGANYLNTLTINSKNTVTITADINASSGGGLGLGCYGCVIYNDIGDNYTFSAANYGSFVITSSSPFSVTATSTNQQNTIFFYNNAQAVFDFPVTHPVHYFRLTNPSVVTITGNTAGNYTLYDMATEADITSGFTSGNTLAAGYYKVVANVPATATANTVSITYTNKYSDLSYNYYNQLGQVIASVAPNGVKILNDAIKNNTLSSIASPSFTTTYQYDLQGRLTSSTSTDGGKTDFVYRSDGKIRFSQNAEQRTAANGGRFSYTNYDVLGRPFESGEYVPQNSLDIAFGSTQGNSMLLESTAVDGGLSGGIRQDWVKTHYDLPDNSHGQGGYVQDEGFLKGAVSWTENANSKTWYNYDDHGRVTWTIKQITALGNKTLNYTYNGQGNVITVDYQRETPAERFLHHYDYDADGRLVKVQTSRDGSVKTQHAKYYYYLHGPLKRVELGDQLQGIDYVYTIQGELKSINHASGDPTKDPNQDGIANYFAPDAFGMQVEYFPNDYARNGSNISSINTGQSINYYNGNVGGISWQTKKSQYMTGYPTIQAPAMYSYSYDAKYQLKDAAWGTPDFSANTFSPNSAGLLKEYNVNYDPNGNITGLQRNHDAGQPVDDFSSYQYQTGTNKLASVGNAANPTGYASYNYDNLGQLKSAQQAGVPFGMYLKYDVTGKITGIYADAALTQLKIGYTYDESGNRIWRTDKTGPTPVRTFYIYDPSGNVLAVYDNSLTITELPVYGSDRLGTYTVNSSTFAYELRDNVGSVRAVINRNKNSDGQVDVLTYNDYYPYGSIARSGGIGYKYDYQGAYAEKDPMTGWNNFALRMYDGKIGRWLSVDPKGQYASPYEGMGNNPVNGNDPTGGFWQELKNWFFTGNWISNAGWNFMSSHEGSYNGWTGNKFTGYASVGYPGPNDEPMVTFFSANQDVIPHVGFYNLWGNTIITSDLYDGRSSFTPGPFVFSWNKKYDKLDIGNPYVQDHYRHEFGHKGQWNLLGTYDYYKLVVIPSIKSFQRHPEIHDYFKTETSASGLGAEIYGPYHFPKLVPVVNNLNSTVSMRMWLKDGYNYIDYKEPAQ